MNVIVFMLMTTKLGFVRVDRLPSRAVFLLILLFGGPAHADDWPQWLGPRRDGIWRESGIITHFPPGGPKVRWRAPIGGGYSGPTVAQGRVYVTDRLVDSTLNKPASAFDKGKIPGRERVLCFREQDGALLWTREDRTLYEISYPAGPRATPLVEGDRVYTLGGMGLLLCLDQSGQVVWQQDFCKKYGIQPPLWGFASHPLLDGEKLICLAGGQGTTVVAFHKRDGRELWRALSASEPGYAPPMIYESAGKRQLIIWHPESVNSLDPETGKVYWSYPFPVRMGLTIATPRLENDRLLVSSFYDGSLMLKLARDKPAAEPAWRGQGHDERRTDGLQSLMATPFIAEGHIYGVCSYGQFRCLKAATGERVWESLAPTGGKEERWANAFIVKNGPRYFLFNEQGDLIIARLSPAKYEELSRVHLLDPVNTDPGRPVVWSHPAFANRSFYGRNDQELICVSLAEN